MDRESPVNDICLDLSLGPTTQAAVPALPSVQPETGEHRHQFLQLLMSSPTLPPSPAAGPPPLPVSFTPVNVNNFHQFASQTVMDLGDYHSFINPWIAPTVVQPSPPPVGPLPPPILLSPPAITIPQPANAPVNTRGPGRPAGAAHQPRRRSAHAAAGAANAEEAAGEKEIVAPYPWATTRPAMVHNLSYLLSKNINVITGHVQCKRCEKTVIMEYNLREKFVEVSRYIAENKEELRDRAPNVWMNPRLPACETCETGMKPVISEKKEEINWLFLWLGQMLGCCTLEQLRYFCDKTKKHRTGAKDRVLYLSYLALGKQLDPNGPFKR